MIIDCCVILVTILFPPAGVFLFTGCGADLCINICLTCLGYFPGHIHAFYIMMTRVKTQPRYTAVYTQQQPTYSHYQQPTTNQQYGQTTPAQQGTSYNTTYQPPAPPQPNPPMRGDDPNISTKKSETFSQPPPYS